MGETDAGIPDETSQWKILGYQHRNDLKNNRLYTEQTIKQK